MTTGHLYVRQIPATIDKVLDLFDMLTTQWQVRAFCYSENLDTFDLMSATANWAGIVANGSERLCPKGRLFSVNGEVRWVLKDNQYEIQLLTESTQTLEKPIWQHILFDHVTPGSQRYYLWGERKDEKSAWLETRIPCILRYPAVWSPTQTMVALVVKEYRQQGVIRLTRLVDVMPISDPKDVGEAYV